MKKISLQRGVSSDAFLLVVVKLVTTVLGLATSRLLSEHLSVYDYGTYSQILLIVSVVSSATILGMMDGVNYFYYASQDREDRENAVASMFTLQCMVSIGAGALIFLLSSPLCNYFDNPAIKNLLIFAAALPALQNMISMMQVLLISVGKASVLALRNFLVSVTRLLVVTVVVYTVESIAVILLTTVVLDFAQLLLFYLVLRKSGFCVRLCRIRGEMVRQILRYCAPMAVFTVVSTLNRDVDKYLVALWTDTETLAVYSNASKILPFDIVITSFTTVLLPQISQSVAMTDTQRATRLYRMFLEIAYLSTTALCGAALAASPQLMKLLYSNKYLSGLNVFRIYIVVDMVRFAGVTMVLSAAGKTARLMVFSVSAVIVNCCLNVLLYHLVGLEGLALATLLTTILLGVCIICSGAKVLGCKIRALFDCKFLMLFAAENIALILALHNLQKYLERMDVHYFVILVFVCALYILIVFALHGRRLLHNLLQVNQTSDIEQ